MKSAVLVCLVCSNLLAGCANQNEVKSLDIRLNELERVNAEAQRKNEALSSELISRKQEERALRNQSAGLRAKVVALNEEIRALNGRIEELEHFFNRQKQTGADEIKADQTRIDQLADSTKTNDERILRIEQYLHLEPRVPEAPESKSSEQTTAKAVPAEQIPDALSEDEIYRMAKHGVFAALR